MAVRNDKVNIRIGATDAGATKTIRKVQREIVAMVGAYVTLRGTAEILQASITEAANLEAKWVSLRSVVEATGRDYNAVVSEMSERTGQLQTDLGLVDSALKGLTTTLTVDQIFNLVDAITDASIAMGELPDQQIPLIIKAIKQLNPAILDNIGVTVRLDKVNTRIKNGYYGAGTALNEFTQQNAIYQEILRQTAQFQGQQAAFLETSKGQFERLRVEVFNLAGEFGGLITQSSAYSSVLGIATSAVSGLRTFIAEMKTDSVPTVEELGQTFEDAADKLEQLNQAFIDGSLAINEFRTEIDAALSEAADITSNRMETIVAQILEMAKSSEEATKVLFALFAEGDMPLDVYQDAQQRINAYYEEMAERARLARLIVEKEWKLTFDHLVITDDRPFQSVEKVWETLAGVIQQGFQLPPDYSGLQSMLESFGFTPEIISEALSDRLTEGVAAARDKLKLLAGIPLPIADGFEEDNERIDRMIEESQRTQLANLSEYHAAVQLAEDLHFDARVAGADRFTQQRAELDRWYSETLTELNSQSVLTEEMTQLAITDLHRVYSIERRQIAADQANEQARLQREALEKSNADQRRFNARANQIMGQYLGSWIDTLVEQRRIGKDFWKLMAEDFAKLFARKALASLANTFIPGLGEALSLFATPKYDALARQEGADFVNQFGIGAEREGDRLGQRVGSSVSFASVPAAANAIGLTPSAGGTTIIQRFEGVVAEDFIDRDVVPAVSLASKRKETSIVGTDDDRFGGSSVYTD